MTLRQAYEFILIEINKVESPTFLLGDFNYLINKACSQYLNKKYNLYDINQQTTDDLSSLKRTAVLTPVKVTENTDSILYGNIHECMLPNDYVHLLNCICEFKAIQNNNCILSGDAFHYAARRLTADTWSQVINNYYFKPSTKRPYYYIHYKNTNINTGSRSNITNPVGQEVGVVDSVNLADLFNNSASNVRINSLESPVVRLEIRYGKEDNKNTLNKVYIDYIKAPQFLELTQDQLDLIDDTSQELEFPGYVCQEIINGLVTLIFENISDQRLQNNTQVNQTVAAPIQQGSN